MPLPLMLIAAATTAATTAAAAVDRPFELGPFPSAQDAARAYDRYSLLLNGIRAQVGGGVWVGMLGGTLPQSQSQSIHGYEEPGSVGAWVMQLIVLLAPLPSPTPLLQTNYPAWEYLASPAECQALLAAVAQVREEHGSGSGSGPGAPPPLGQQQHQLDDELMRRQRSQLQHNQQQQLQQQQQLRQQQLQHSNSMHQHRQPYQQQQQHPSAAHVPQQTVLGLPAAHMRPTPSSGHPAGLPSFQHHQHISGGTSHDGMQYDSDGHIARVGSGCSALASHGPSYRTA